MDLKIVPLHHSQIKRNFACGNSVLDNYIHTQARQDVKRKLSVCFVLTGPDKIIKGYYTLSNAGISKDLIPTATSKKLPKAYTHLPVTLLGRLAVDKSLKGKGLGSLLLIDALKRCFEVSVSEIGSMAVVVDPIDEGAVEFYHRYGFISLPDSGKMMLPMKTISALFKT